MNINKYSWLGIAFLLHVALWLVGSLLFVASVPPIIGNSTTNVMQAYLDVREDKSSLATNQRMQETKQLAEISKTQIEKLLKKQVVATQAIKQKSKQTQTKMARQSIARSGRRKGISTQGLLALLHSAIQQHQRYPVSAQELEREGRVTINFMLQPDGHIFAVQVAKSSGTTSLDEAAMVAVKEAAPITGVRQYIDQTKAFNVDVVFELG